MEGVCSWNWSRLISPLRRFFLAHKSIPSVSSAFAPLLNSLAMALDSTAVSALRIKELGLEEITNNMEGEDWNTHAAFAYSCAYTPGTADDASFQNDVVFPILGNDPR